MRKHTTDIVTESESIGSVVRKNSGADMSPPRAEPNIRLRCLNPSPSLTKGIGARKLLHNHTRMRDNQALA